MRFINIKLKNNIIVQLDIHTFTLREWLKLQDIVIEQYGFNQFLEYTSDILKTDDERWEEECKWMIEHC